MHNIYVFEKFDKININYDFKKLPISRQNRVEKLKTDLDKKISIFEYLFIKDKLGLKNEDFLYEKNGKPYVPGKLFFSISHSCGALAICISSKKCGIDIEKIRHYDFDMAKMICNGNEISEIEKSRDKDFLFTKYFTMKEATLKCCDLLLDNDLKSIISHDYIYKTKKHNKYIVSVCEEKIKK